MRRAGQIHGARRVLGHIARRTAFGVLLMSGAGTTGKDYEEDR
ncbi:hypothetical protein D554_1538 [Bordetella holmesii 30539]|uniref:N-acetyltransferase YedL n=1 Tax=Bordetella holmesii 1058 TaxID=1247648 RepID=A0ABN0S4P5_9BORD|nr:hypothetical protein D560_2084 [Bordetella holmesii ATCC 51541]EXF88725.1 hypothetical protein D554_1538 [Bordetella holmesii 30539]EXX96548.1 hypothetical protein D559_0176 [Bordetella holmesii 1058]